MRRWMQWHAHGILRSAQWLTGFRLSVEGTIPPTSCILVMNHQSVLDIPIAVSLVGGPYPRFPVRERYIRGIPGFSPLMRLARCIPVSQRRVALRAEVARLSAAAEQVARGEQSLVIFPEGHRTRTGEINPFMVPGLRLILERARGRPVFCVVVDGLWQLRTFSETAFGLGGASARVVVLGPFLAPERRAEIDQFIEKLRDRMVATLAGTRSSAHGGFS